MNRLLTALMLALCSLPAGAADWGSMRPSEVAVYVRDLQSGEVLVSHRADEAVNPASTMKLLTAFAALDVLGSGYRFQTAFKSSAPLHNGTLAGDLYWQGSGDPVLDQNGLRVIQQQLRERGIRRIGGQLVLDRSLWPHTGSADDFHEDAGRAFTTPPDPVMLAYKVVWLTPERNAAGSIDIRTSPPLPDIPQQTDVSVYPSAVPCSLPQYLQAAYRNGTLRIAGRLPESCLGKSMFVNMLETADFAARSFNNQWRADGGEIGGGFREAAVPPQAATLAVARSKPLSAVVADMNRYSNNLIARTLLLTLGTRQAGDSWRNGQAQILNRLQAYGLDTGALVLENGSGLSRRERLSARLLGEMLDKAFHSRFREAFIDSLPVPGGEGTLKNRFLPLGSALRLKTGTLDNVRAVAGYWLGGNGTPPLAVVVIVNSSRAPAYLGDLDALVGRLIADAALK